MHDVLYLLSFIGKKGYLKILFLFLIALLMLISELTSFSLFYYFVKALLSQNEANLVWAFYKFEFQTPENYLLFITTGFIVAVLLTLGLRLTILWWGAKIAAQFGIELGHLLYKRILLQPYIVHISRNSSEVISGLTNKIEIIVNGAILPLLNLISSAIVVLSIGGFLLVTNFLLTIIIIIGLALSYLVIVAVSRPILLKNGRMASMQSNKQIQSLQEGLGGIRDVILDGAEDIYCNQFTVTNTLLRNMGAINQFIAQSPRYIIEALGVVLILIVTYFFALRGAGLDKDILPSIAVMGLAAQRIFPLMQQIFASWAIFNSSRAVIGEAANLTRMPIRISTAKYSPVIFEKSIELKNVSYIYPGVSSNVLSDVNLIVEKGSTLGVVGPTGSGKSTLIDLLMGLLTPSTGYMAIDSILLEPRNVRSWQTQVAHVPQNIFLSDISIAENIAFGVPLNSINMKRVVEVAKLAQIDGVISEMTNGYMSLAGERGSRLSGGQKQRIGIARALYKNAKVLILDEATSALDEITEDKVMNSLIGKLAQTDGITVIMISHRLSTLKSCDRILRVESGRVFEVNSLSLPPQGRINEK